MRDRLLRAAHGDNIEVAIPQRSTAVISGEQGPFAQRDRHLATIAERGRVAWQKATDYSKRSFVETTMGRYKALMGGIALIKSYSFRQEAYVFPCTNM
jgi:hypothetical protein